MDTETNSTATFDRNNFFLKEWPEALESGEFSQGRNFLNMDRYYCCLGVACELLARKGMLKSWTPDVLGAITYYDEDATFLPQSAQEILGLDEAGTFYETGGRETSLQYQNDSGKTFSEIAQTIRTVYQRRAFRDGTEND